MKIETSQIHRDIKHIELFVRKLLLSGVGGNYLSALKGSGLQFEEVRAYEPGDDVRRIDWNITARTDQPYVKIFKEERELQIVLLVDTSASTDFGTQHESKRQLLAHVAAVFAFLAVKNNDRVGLGLFSDGLDSYIPPKKGQKHAYRVVDALMTHDAKRHATNMGAALQNIYHRLKKRSVVIILSDFFTNGYERELKMLANKHDVIPIVVSDPREQTWSSLGVIQLSDLETGKTVWVDSDTAEFKRHWQRNYQLRMSQTSTLLKQMKMDFLEFKTGESILKPLSLFFKRRAARRAY